MRPVPFASRKPARRLPRASQVKRVSLPPTGSAATAEVQGRLRVSPGPRALGCLFWAFFERAELKAAWHRRGQSAARLRAAGLSGGARLVLDFADGARIGLAPAQRWRLWRRPRAALA